MWLNRRLNCISTNIDTVSLVDHVFVQKWWSKLERKKNQKRLIKSCIHIATVKKLSPQLIESKQPKFYTKKIETKKKFIELYNAYRKKKWLVENCVINNNLLVNSKSVKWIIPCVMNLNRFPRHRTNTMILFVLTHTPKSLD